MISINVFKVPPAKIEQSIVNADKFNKQNAIYNIEKYLSNSVNLSTDAKIKVYDFPVLRFLCRALSISEDDFAVFIRAKVNHCKPDFTVKKRTFWQTSSFDVIKKAEDDNIHSFWFNFAKKINGKHFNNNIDKISKNNIA